jgi:hypothetical protein
MAVSLDNRYTLEQGRVYLTARIRAAELISTQKAPKL